REIGKWSLRNEPPGNSLASVPARETTMRGLARSTTWVACGWPLLAGFGAAALLATSDAEAHFRLMYPPQWVQEQDTLGDPQKAGPCGVDSSVSYTMTNAVTTFAPGQKIKVQWQETVAHDGWFRIALSYKNRTDLTDPPYAVN